MKIPRPPIRPLFFYEKTGEDNPYLNDDFDYWQVNSVKPSPLPKSWVLNLEKQPTSNKSDTITKLPQILNKQSNYRSSSTYKKPKLY